MISTARAVRAAATSRTLLAVVVGALVAVCTVALAAAPAQAAPAWPVATVANPTPKQSHAQFQSISCPSATFCLAVGSHVATDGQFAPFAETFNGKTWHVTTVSVPGSNADGFLSVSCSDKSFCMATTTSDGTPRVALWKGSSWTLQNLATANVTGLSDVQCRSHTMCMAVGLVGAQAAAWHYNGNGWFRQTLPSPKTHGLNAVSCPSVTVCYAAGSTSSGNSQYAYVVRWNGKSWAASSLPKSFGTIDDITCLSTTRCTGVGNGGQFGDHVLVVDLSGGAWKYSSVKTNTGAPTGIAVGCTSSACTAILNYETNDESIATSIAVRGKTGGFVKSAQSYPDLSGLSCSGTSCLVVGSTLLIDRSGFTIGDQNTPATAYRRNGSKLVRMPVPQPDGRTPNDFTQISCAGGLCAAIDQDATSGAVWLRKSAGAAWAPVAGTAQKGYVDVSCSASPTVFCMAVGRGISLRYQSGTWTSAAMPQPQGKGKDDIFAVSCVSPIWCEAVGTTGTDGAEGKILSEHWTGTWTVDQVGAKTLSALDGISCTSIDDCLAVGYRLGGEEPVPVVEKLHQGSWSVAATTGLPSTTSLEDVSCWSATGCMVTSPGNFGAAASATWDGSTFTEHPLAGDTPTGNDVSCSAANSCTVVGVYFGLNRFGSQLIEHWDGGTWHIVASQTVSGNQPSFNGVSCSASGACTAVGYVNRAYDIALVSSGTV